MSVNELQSALTKREIEADRVVSDSDVYVRGHVNPNFPDTRWSPYPTNCTPWSMNGHLRGMGPEMHFSGQAHPTSLQFQNNQWYSQVPCTWGPYGYWRYLSPQYTTLPAPQHAGTDPNAPCNTNSIFHYGVSGVSTDFPRSEVPQLGLSFYNEHAPSADVRNVMLVDDPLGVLEGRQTSPEQHEQRLSSGVPSIDEISSPVVDEEEADTAVPNVPIEDEILPACSVMEDLIKSQISPPLQPGESRAVEESILYEVIRRRANEEGLLCDHMRIDESGLMFCLTAGSSLGACADRAQTASLDSIDRIFARFYGFHSDPKKPSGQSRHVVFHLRADQPGVAYICIPGPKHNVQSICDSFARECHDALYQ